MNLFIFELVCAGGLGPRPPLSLWNEGWAMLTALVDDFDHVPGVQSLTLIERSCPHSVGSVCRRVAPGEERAAFAETVSGADLVLVIAPEEGGLLADRSRLVLRAGKRLLGSGPQAIDLTGDKAALAQRLADCGIPTPAAYLAGNPEASGCVFPAVCKPRCGAGSQATFLIRTKTDLEPGLAEARRELPGAEFLLQPYVPGQPASVTFLVGPRQKLALLPASQRLSADGRFRYLGGRVPLPEPLVRRAVDLSRRAVDMVAGLGGMVGVDLIMGEADDGSLDRVIEINPRPTTSYVGLRQLAIDNLAGAALKIARGETVSPIRWRDGTIPFSTTGMGP
jgi:predicted ATP-grasp superfamily ATP-dependent carboligase